MRIQSEVEQLIRKRLLQDPAEEWLRFKDRRYSWREVVALSQRAANGLLDVGLRPGDRVAIMAGNSPEFLWAYFGSLMIGCEVVPINKWQRGESLCHMFNDSATKAVIYDPDLESVIVEHRGRCPGLKWGIVFGESRAGTAVACFGDLLASRDREPAVELEKVTPAVGILYTSGTTGPPKGILARTLEPSVVPVLASCGIRPGEVIYTCMPLFHASGLLVYGVGSIRLGARLALGESFSASNFLQECTEHGAVSANVFGVMIPYLLKQAEREIDRTNSLRTVLSVGCPASAWREFETRFGVRIVEFYGASDTPGFLVNSVGRVGSVGKPVDGAEFAIVDDLGNPLPPKSIGEIVYRHPQGRGSAYNNLPDVTEHVWRGGWFHSGDLGEQDEEGFFYFHGRSKEAIRRRGENISAWEVSTVVDLHPKVQESAAFGVPSDLGEEEVMVAVVPVAGAELKPEEILEFCQGRLAHFAVPRFIELLPELPKTSTQKIQHLVLKARGRTERTWDREQAGFAIKRI